MNEYKIAVQISIVANPLSEKQYTVSYQFLQNILKTNLHGAVEDKLFDLTETILTEVRDDIRAEFIGEEDDEEDKDA